MGMSPAPVVSFGKQGRSSGFALVVKRGRKRDQNDQRSVSRVHTVSLEPTIHEIPRSLEPASQYLLWIDGVGGVMVCLSRRATRGYANPESIVEIPLLADVSPH